MNKEFKKLFCKHIYKLDKREYKGQVRQPSLQFEPYSKYIYKCYLCGKEKEMLVFEKPKEVGWNIE